MKRIKEYIPIPAFVILCITVFSALLMALFCIFPGFSDFFNGTVAAAVRFILAGVTSLLPFSLGEFIIFSLPVTVFLVLRFLYAYMDRHEHGFVRGLFIILSMAGILFSLFVFDFASGYHGTSLDEKMNIKVIDINEDNLKSTAEYMVEKINSLTDNVSFSSDGSSYRGYSHSDTVEYAYDGYEKVSEEYSFIKNFKAPVKRLVISKLMTYTHISGVYSYYTGEANLNFNYPEFVNVYTIAHEMAHQRGISREDEANFVAYLVCISSENDYMQYSGYLMMLEYLTDALGETSAEAVKEIYSSLSNKAYGDLVNYSKFFSEYSENTAADVTEVINDTNLKLQGTEGTVSYGLVTRLAVSYYADYRN